MYILLYKSPSLPLHIFCGKDTAMDSMTHDTEGTMISPTGLITMTATEATTIINRCILPGMQRKPVAHSRSCTSEIYCCYYIDAYLVTDRAV